MSDVPDESSVESEPLANPSDAFSPAELDGMSPQELTRLIEAALDRLPIENLVAVSIAAEERREAKQEETRQMLLEEFRERAQQVGMQFDALFPSYGYGARKRRSDSGGSLPVRYRSPGGETWTGRGRKPRWLEILEREGHDKEEFRVS